MDPLQQALRGASHTAPQPLAVRQTLLVVGGGGVLGSAILSESLVAGRFLRVMALVAESLSSAVRGFEPWPEQALRESQPLKAEVAVIVFERARRSHGRDDVFVQPEVSDLLPLAQALHRSGIRRLLVVVPHAPALLPQALAHGLASLEEAAVVALGFEHLVWLRAAQSASRPLGLSRMQRFADWWLSQLAWMVPQRQQPVRAAALARCVAQLAQALPLMPPGTRVMAPETLWQWAQQPEGLAAALEPSTKAATT
jgi:hypothetical protein